MNVGEECSFFSLHLWPSVLLYPHMFSCCEVHHSYSVLLASPAKFLQLKSGTGLAARASILSTCMSLRAAARWSAVLPFRSGKLTEAPA